jgi:hypothetical protein
MGGALASWTRHVLAALLLVGPAAAQGNVLAFVDGQGNLRVFGDEASNQLVLLYERPFGELVVEGVGGTTVNGMAEMRPIVPGTRFEFVMGGGDDVVRFGRFDDGGCCDGRDILFFGGEGDDYFRVGDEEAGLARVYADLGPGNDRFWAGEDGSIVELILFGGEGDDVLDGFFSFMSGSATIDLGPGADLVDLREHVSLGAFSIDTGPGGYTILHHSIFLGVSLPMVTGVGDDLVAHPVELAAAGEAGPVMVDTGAGADRIRLNGSVDVESGITLQAGEDADVVELDAAHVLHGLGVSLGTGNDTLVLAGSSFAALDPIVLDGAEGVDRYIDRGGNTFAVLPLRLNFEGPFAFAEPPPLVAATRIVGKVVQNGEAVPGASVSVPRLGLVASSGTDGSFDLGPVVVPLTRLELAVGATVRGRRHAALAARRPSPEGVTDFGAVTVAPTRSTVLIFGDAASDALQLEQQLRTLGRDPAAIVCQRFLPQDLSAFEVVWHVPAAAPLTAAERERLAAFVHSGGGLHLAGEGDLVQTAHAELVNALLADPDVAVVAHGPDSSFPIAYNSDATGGVTQQPNPLGLVQSFQGSRVLTGIEPENAFIVGATGKVFAGVWSSRDLTGGKGHLSLGLITLWLRSPQNLDAVENLQSFLQREPDVYTAR